MKNLQSRFLKALLLGAVPVSLTQVGQAGVDLISGDSSAALPIFSQSFDSPANGGQVGFNINATGNNFLFVPGAAGTLTAPSEAGNLLATDGAYNAGALAQTVMGLAPGAMYAVSFYYAGAQQQGGGFITATTESWTAGLGGSFMKMTPTFINTAESFTGWNHQTYNLTTDGKSETLTFLASGTADDESPFSLLGNLPVGTIPTGSMTGIFMGCGALVVVGGSILRRKALLSEQD